MHLNVYVSAHIIPFSPAAYYTLSQNGGSSYQMPVIEGSVPVTDFLQCNYVNGSGCQSGNPVLTPKGNVQLTLYRVRTLAVSLVHCIHVQNVATANSCFEVDHLCHSIRLKKGVDLLQDYKWFKTQNIRSSKRRSTYTRGRLQTGKIRYSEWYLRLLKL